MKQKFIKSAAILIILSIIAKILSFIVRIILARTLDSSALAYYSLLNPTIVIIITIAQMGIPNALAKLVASDSKCRGIVKSSIILSILNNICLCFIFALIIPVISHLIYRDDNLIPCLVSVFPLIPIITISGLLKGYLIGRQEHVFSTFSSIIEEVVRIAFILFCFNYYNGLNSIMMCNVAILSISVSEIASIVFMFIRTFFITRYKRKYPLATHYREILNLSLPMTGARIVGSLTYFLEPIIMIAGFNIVYKDLMIESYSILNNYVVPLITMPSFISVTLSTYLLSSFTFLVSKKQYRQARKLLFTIVLICLFIGIVCGLGCYYYSDTLLRSLFHNSSGIEFTKLISFPFIIYSIQPVLSSILHAYDKSKSALFSTITGSVVRLLIVFSLTPFIKGYSLLLALILGMLTTTLIHLFNVIRYSKQYLK